MIKTILILILLLLCQVDNTFSNNINDSLVNNINQASTTTEKYEANYLAAMYYYDKMQDMRASLPYFYNAGKYAIRANMLTEYADMHNFMGICYETLGMHDSAIVCFNIYLELSKNQKNDKGIANAYKNIGLVYEFSGDYDNAILHYVEASKVSDKLNDTILIIDSYLNIGGVYRSIEQFEKSEEYFIKALKLNNCLNDDLMYARIYNQLAILEKNCKNYDKALEYYNLSLQHSDRIGWDKGIAAAYSNIGSVYTEIGKYHKALDYHLKSLEIEEKLNHFYGIRISKNSLSSIYIELGNYSEAERYANDAYQMAKTENNYEGMAESVKYLFEVSLEKGDTDKTLNYFYEYAECLDSIYSIESLEKIADIEILYQTEKKEQKIEFLNVQNQLEKDKNHKQKLFIVILVSMLSIALILTIVIWHIYIQKQKAYKALVKMNIQAVKCEQSNEDAIVVRVNDSESDRNQYLDLSEKLNNYIVTEKPYLESDFNIDKLAKSLDSNRQYISKTINDFFGKNFSTFINEYRVKEARKMLLNSEFDRFTMEAIAEKCGFSNRTSFIDAFKKYTGVTPSYFKSNSAKIKS